MVIILILVYVSSIEHNVVANHMAKATEDSDQKVYNSYDGYTKVDEFEIEVDGISKYVVMHASSEKPKT
ncbi:MAG: hypothetical protein LBE09_05330, partial [Christensenellaceae bacterium]|nr:hypothetical protein [Christensenellaceae bacterium]